jgi:hypothetical protein
MGSSSGRTNSTRRRGVKRTRDDDELGDARPASGGTDEPAAPIRRSQDPKGDCGAPRKCGWSEKGAAIDTFCSV